MSVYKWEEIGELLVMSWGGNDGLGYITEMKYDNLYFKVYNWIINNDRYDCYWRGRWNIKCDSNIHFKNLMWIIFEIYIIKVWYFIEQLISHYCSPLVMENMYISQNEQIYGSLFKEFIRVKPVIFDCLTLKDTMWKIHTDKIKTKFFKVSFL